MASLLMTSSNGHKVNIGAKTATRRLSGLEAVNANPELWSISRQKDGVFILTTETDNVSFCKPKFIVGQVVSIREPHYLWGWWMTIWSESKQKAERVFERLNMNIMFPDNPPDKDIEKGIQSSIGWYLRPSMFQFEKDVRTHVRITGVGCSRLQSITEEQVKTEGVNGQIQGIDAYCYNFAQLWDSINKKSGHGWDRNDWVFDYEFERI